MTSTALAEIEAQYGLCYYSGIAMKFEHHADYTCSLERLDNTLGETVENTVLVCAEAEFNTTAQFSRDKFNYMLHELYKYELATNRLVDSAKPADDLKLDVDVKPGL